MLRNLRFLNVLFILSFLLGTNFYGQQTKRLDSKEGLVNGTINAFERDSLGFLWIGTDQGLNRYSGLEFKSYSLSDNQETRGKGVVDILNLQGKLYLITSSGFLFQYSYDYDRFEELFHYKEREFLSFTHLNDSDLLIGLSSGFIVYNIKNRQASEVQYGDIVLNRVVMLQSNKVYSGTSKGLNQFDYNPQTKKLTFQTRFLPNQDIIDFNIDHRNRIWVGTEVGGLYILDGEETIQKSLSQIQGKTYAIRKINFDQNNKALIAVDRLGLFILNEDFETLRTYSHEVDNENSLSQNSIYEIYVDDTNAYWLGVREGGINIVYENDNVFNNIFHIQNNPNSISNNNIRSIYETSDGTLWFGTENGASRLSGGRWANFNAHPKLFNTAVLGINKYQNKLLFGTYGEGVLSIDERTGNAFEVIFGENKPLKFVFLIESFQDDLWVGGSDGPLSRYGRGSLIDNYPIGLERSIVEGYDEIVYAATNSGFYEINKRNKSTRKIAPEIFNTKNETFDLNFDERNNCIWISTKNGLYKYELKSEKVEHIGERLQHQIGTVYSTQKDNLQNLYLACISGLWRYDIRSKIFRKYGEQDGLKINEFGFGASAKLKDGSLAFGGPEGAVIFDPIKFIKDDEVTDIFISNFLINGKKPDSITQPKNINFTKELVLDYDQNSISFNYETVKFHGSKRNLFEWKLKGYDSIYRSVYGNGKIAYANLKPGTYTLDVRGYNADGLVGKKNYSIQFVVKNPFWKTWWAIALYILVFFIILYLIFRVTRANIRKKIDEDRIKFFIEVAHDIRTPVSLIQLLVNQLSDQKNSRKTLDLIKRNSQNLNEYVTQLLDFQKIDRNQLKLSVSKVDLKNCLSEIVNDFTPLLQEKSIDIELNVKHIPVWFDNAKMSRIFYNLISNAIKYSHEGGLITIKSYLSDDYLNIDFIDQGIGIPEKQQELIFKRFTRGTNVSNKGIPGTGIGLMLSKKIVELHGGKISLQSKENIGSTFTVILPSGTEHYSNEDLIEEIDTLEDHHDPNLEDLLGKNKLILLIEDNDELRNAVKTELAENFMILEATNGKEGLLTALSKNPDLIITDVMMPIMDGKELCHLLKTNFKTSHIPVVMLTALADIDNKIEGLETGADAYVEKPFNVEVLKATIKNLIRSRENIRYLLDEEEVKKELTPDERFLSDVIDTIKKNLVERDFSIDTLCEMMGLSRSNMFRKLKGLIQMSPSDLILKIKLDKAEDLMKQKKFTRISDIAYESGFQDPKYFSTLFKKHYNKTPKEFIEEL